MKLTYKVPMVDGIGSMIASYGGADIKETSQPYLEWYLTGLKDAGAIESYRLEPVKEKLLSMKIHQILTIEIVDENRKDRIDTTLRKSYKAEPVTQTV